MQINYEIGRTTESDAFFDRHPRFWPAFERLILAVNKSFGREYIPHNRAEDLCFDLGQKCREDFGEVLFLAVHGHAKGATKLLRGLYERAVALAYITQYPEKAERFVRYAAIQEHKLLVAALKVVSEESFDAALGPATTANQIREFYKTIKPEFQETVCKKCGTTKTAGTWDIDVASMVQKVGDPFDKYYLGAYALPNLEIHATLASAYGNREPQEESDFALFHVTGPRKPPGRAISVCARIEDIVFQNSGLNRPSLEG